MLLVMAVSSAPPRSQAQTPEVLAVRAGSTVRVSATGSIRALRLEVFARGGDKLFDSQSVPGAAVDWLLFDPAGAPLADGRYYYTLTIAYESGFLVRQLGRVALRWNRALVHPQFIERVGPTGEVLGQTALEDDVNSTGATSGGLFQFDLSSGGSGDGKPILTFLNPLPAPAFTSAGGRALVARGCCDGQGGGALVAQFGNGAVLDEGRQAILAHDGTDGRLVIRGGALRLSTGNLFDGTDVERLRLTAAGDVGIGVSSPTAKLDVAGEIKGTMITTPMLNATTQYNLGGARILATAGPNNLFAGVGAGTANTTGSENAFFGASAGFNNTSGGGNAFFGALAGRANNEGGNNAFFGALAGRFNTTGGSNAFFGTSAGRNNITGFNNAFFGHNAGNQNTTASDNAFFGTSAGFSNITGGGNAFFGRNAGRFNTTGGSNAFFGAEAGRFNTASANAFFGASAGFSNTTGLDNAFFGAGAGFSNTAGSDNAFFGHEAGRFNTASANAFFGASAGFNNTTGGGNAFFGQAAGVFNTTGFNNAFFGASAGFDNTTGFDNAFFGRSAGQFNTTGRHNAFFGVGSGQANTTGQANAFFGEFAGDFNGTGSDNAFFGTFAGHSNLTGSLNTLIGHHADVPDGAGDLTRATALGAFARVGCSNCMALGATGIDAVNVGIGLTTTTFRLHLAENSAAKPGSASWTVASDRRLKRDIRPYTDGLAKLLQLHPVWYRYNGQAGLPADQDYVGVIAQEAQAVVPYTVSAYRAKLHPADAEATELLHFDGGALTFMTINAVRELHAQVAGLRGADAGEVARLRAENAAQQQRLAEQQQRVSDLEQRLAALERRVRNLTRE